MFGSEYGPSDPDGSDVHCCGPPGGGLAVVVVVAGAFVVVVVAGAFVVVVVAGAFVVVVVAGAFVVVVVGPAVVPGAPRGGSAFAGSISTAPRSHRSDVGFMSWITTGAPAVAFAVVVSCVQNVLPICESTNCETRDCPGAGVRGTPLSQSLPVAQTQPPVIDGVNDTVGEPPGPLADRTLEMVLLAPLKAASVMLPSKPRTSRDANTLRWLTADADQASHTSAVPARALDLTARVQVRPPPDRLVTHCDDGAAGPSTAMNATISSFAPEVEIKADLRVVALDGETADAVTSSAMGEEAAPLVTAASANPPPRPSNAATIATVRREPDAMSEVFDDTCDHPFPGTSKFPTLVTSAREGLRLRDLRRLIRHNLQHS